MCLSAPWGLMICILGSSSSGSVGTSTLVTSAFASMEEAQLSVPFVSGVSDEAVLSWLHKQLRWAAKRGNPASFPCSHCMFPASPCADTHDCMAVRQIRKHVFKTGHAYLLSLVSDFILVVYFV